jgi:hypothetical protein
MKLKVCIKNDPAQRACSVLEYKYEYTLLFIAIMNRQICVGLHIFL